MLRNTVVNSTNFFYPIGNTPAVCLTQNLPPEEDASILLLGCGDARNILFTTYLDPGRHLDITCCDIEPSILARNILLFTLLIDNGQPHLIWNIYYHVKLDEPSAKLLSSQSRKLELLCTSLEQWHSSSYGSILRFSDLRTFMLVKTLWSCWDEHSNAQIAPSSQLLKAMKRANEWQKIHVPEGSAIFSGSRSAAPVSIAAIKDVPKIYDQYWKTGTVELDNATAFKRRHLNASFLYTPNDALTLHYGLDPLLGFHLAPAYIPTMSKSVDSPNAQKKPASSLTLLVDTARLQFRQWCDAFRQAHVRGKIIIRSCSADALAFCHTLQYLSTASEVKTANLTCDNWTFDPLILNDGNYQAGGAPTNFNVVDTSNLVDHLGMLNILVATVPLLAPRTSSILYCEALVNYHSDLKNRMQSQLCGDFATITALLGLACVEAWTNATAVPEVEEAIINDVIGGKDDKRGGQSRTRLCFKRLDQISSATTTTTAVDSIGSQAQLCLKIKADDLSNLMHSVYTEMFAHESVITLRTAMLQSSSKVSNPYYNRASFAAFLKHIKNYVSTDWNHFMELFRSAVENIGGGISVSANFLQELYQYLHVYGLHTVDACTTKFLARYLSRSTPDKFATWKDIPTIVCLTVTVSREKLAQILDMPSGKAGTPPICCTVETSTWANTFSTVQVGFGVLRTTVQDQEPKLHIEQDASCWAGKSSMIISFFMPTWVLLQADFSAILVRCGLLCTPTAAMAFMRNLGPNLAISEFRMKDVNITRYMPNMDAYPCITTSREQNPQPSVDQSPPGADFLHETTAIFSKDALKIVSVVHKTIFLSEKVEIQLANKESAVDTIFLTPLAARVTIGLNVSYQNCFPMLVAAGSRKLRIARKSGYVELEAPLLNDFGSTQSSSQFVFPITLEAGTAGTKKAHPVLWTMPYTNLALMPDIETQHPKKIDWLTTHVTFAMSTRERKLREAGIAKTLPANAKQDLRVELKDGIFSMFIHYSGVQGGRAQLFGLHEPSSGMNVIFMVSSLKLDLANHTVLLDLAVIPLTTATVADVGMHKFLSSLQQHNLCGISVTPDELRLWKALLPAFVERCRTWTHRTSCEYNKTGEVPAAGGLEPERTPLCSCGLGQFPKGYLAAHKIPGLRYALDKWATRAVISPIYSVPYVEDCLLGISDATAAAPSRSLPLRAGQAAHGSQASTPGLQAAVVPKHLEADTRNIDTCLACGATKPKAADAATKTLMKCGLCKKARYCSAECQKSHWKQHKLVCVAT